jgi:hypothetical protein
MTKMNIGDKQKLGPESAWIQVQSWPEMHLKFIWGKVICANWQKHTHVDYLDIHNLNFVSEFHKYIEQEFFLGSLKI